MRAAFQREMDVLEANLAFLASVGSVSPYIGLFGTVWGIMNAFRGLANVQQATLANVAPGIAEALIATAIGLFAAIPAVIASGGLQVVKIAGGEGTGETGWGPIIIATVIAFAVGYAVIAWFMKFIETHTFTPFMIYRILLALGLFALLGTGTISA